MSDYGTMQARIADELNRSDLTSQIKLAIQSSIDFYERERFWFNEGISYASTSAGEEWYLLPNDFVNEDALTCTVTSNEYPLDKWTMQQHVDVRVGTTYQGIPRAYSLYDEQIRLYPIPNDVYVITLYYMQRLTELSAGSDTNAWTTHGELLIRSRAKWDLYQNLIHAPEQAVLMKQMEMEAFANIRGEVTKRTTTGRVRPWGY